MACGEGVSVVIPTFRRPELLERCLRTLGRQTYPMANLEVIVCDDGPDEETARVVERLARDSEYRLRYLAILQSQGPAAARNRGWEAASHRLIAFTDDDTIPDSRWLAEGEVALRGALAVSGRVVVPLPPEPTDYEKNEAGLMQAEFVTANCFVRKSALLAVGGFDERFTAAWREDSDLHFKLLATTIEPHLQRIVRCHAAVVAHPVRPASWGISLRQQRKSLFDALLYANHPVLYRERISRRPPLLYYGAVTSAATALAAIVAGAQEVLVVATGAWIAVTATFCKRRLDGTSRSLSHRVEMVVTSSLIPLFAVYWRLLGAIKFRVPFL